MVELKGIVSKGDIISLHAIIPLTPLCDLTCEHLFTSLESWHLKVYSGRILYMVSVGWLLLCSIPLFKVKEKSSFLGHADLWQREMRDGGAMQYPLQLLLSSTMHYCLSCFIDT